MYEGVAGFGVGVFVGATVGRGVGRTVGSGVGLGVSSGPQASEVAAYADAVIVGSALVGCLLDADDTAAGLGALHRLTAELAAGVRGGSR